MRTPQFWRSVFTHSGPKAAGGHTGGKLVASLRALNLVSDKHAAPVPAQGQVSSRERIMTVVSSITEIEEIEENL